MKNLTYRHCTAGGTHYETGYELGRQLLADKALLKDLITPVMGGQPLSESQAEINAALFEKYMSGINEEIKGFADAVNIPYTDMVIYSSYINLQCGCSHFIISKDSVPNKEIYHARSYEFHWHESPVLLTTRVNEKKGSTGFGCKIFGRFDGMNEHGLCVTMSSVDINHTGTIGNGFVFPMAVRAMLDNCSTAYEAREMFIEMPYAEYRNFLISDKSGDAVLIEASPSSKSYQHINSDEKYNYLCSADHFVLNQSTEIRPVCHSIVRQNKMTEILSSGKMTELDDIKAFMAKRYPNGLEFPYYEDGFGTLWSNIYNPVTLDQYVCYGSPKLGEWNLIDQHKDYSCSKQTISLFNENAPEGFDDYLD